MTPQQVHKAIRARKAASAALHEQITALDNDETLNLSLTVAEIGMMKHRMICWHRYEHMRKAFVCTKCWTDLPICVCPLFEREADVEQLSNENVASNDDICEKHKAKLPSVVNQLIIWTHHEEWGRTANTGSLLCLGLDRTKMLMKGLEEHEEIMNNLLNREDLTPVVFWPGKGQESNATVTIPELRSRFIENNQRIDRDYPTNSTGGILLISIEGTWNNARKMANKLPPTVLGLDLGDEIATNFTSPDVNGGILYNPDYSSTSTKSGASSPSLLAPLRRQGRGKHGNGPVKENVSTLEATIVALLALGLSVKDADRILGIARTKVDRILEYSGKGSFRR